MVFQSWRAGGFVGVALAGADMTSAAVNVDERIAVPAAPELVWMLLTDPLVVVECMPGASVLAMHPDGSVDGSLTMKLGPTTVSFQGRVVPVFEADSRQGHIEASGVDGVGRSRARAVTTFSVTAAGPDASEVAITSTIDVTGVLANFVKTGGPHLVRRMLADFADNLRATAVERQAQPAATTDVAEHETRTASAKPAAPVSVVRLVLQATFDAIRSALRSVRNRFRPAARTTEGGST